jgi:fluoride exporter
MLEILLVFIGGSIGSSLRYFLSCIAHDFGCSYQGTFIINIIGCFFFGFVAYIALKKESIINPNLKLFLTTGIAGGFTTFSTFSYESFKLIQNGLIMTAWLYIVLSTLIGIAFALFGYSLAKNILILNAKVKNSQLIESLKSSEKAC